MNTVPEEYIEYIGWKLPADHVMVPRLMEQIGKLFQNEEGEWMRLIVMSLDSNRGDSLYLFSGRPYNPYE